jgi:glycosyltransferase involved in cell wall biosynthesis
MMRPGLAYVVNSLHPGGTEKLVVEMALAFSEDYRVEVFCLDEPGHWAQTLRQRGVAVSCLWRQPGLDLRMPLCLAHAFRRMDARIVHAHQCTPWFYSALARLLHPGFRLLLEEHGRFYPETDHPARKLVNRLLISRLTHRFVAVSADVGKRLVRYEGLDPKRIEVIYNGIGSIPSIGEDRRKLLRREFGWAEGDFVVGTVGRFDPIKNLPMLVKAIGNARARNSRIQGLLVGDGPEMQRIRDLVEESGLTEAIRLTGFRDDARTLAQCMDLFVLASLSEGTSMALLEAAAAGVPAAVTAVGGNPEVVVGGQTGWVIPSEAEDALSAAILEAAGDAELRRRFTIAARERVEERFTFAKMIDAYRGLYRTLAPVSA